MKIFRASTVVCVMLLCAVVRTAAQDGGTSTSSASARDVDNPSEWSKFQTSCLSFNLKEAGGCAELLFTGKPLHIAVGSLAPQNGFGAGLAYVGFLQPSENWRPSWNADAVATPNGSWRAGIYFKFVHTPPGDITVQFGKPKIKSNLTELPEHTAFNVYAQAISLNTVSFFGEGPFTTLSGRSSFGMREVIPGANVVRPFSSHWNVSLLGEVNGRFVDIRASHGNNSPSISSIYNPTTAPGLSSQPGFLQLGEGIRMRPIFRDDFVHLNYTASYQEFFAPGNSHYQFQRFTLDLAHDFALYRSTTRFYLAREANGPDECTLSTDLGFPGCKLSKLKQMQDCTDQHGNNSAPCKAISRDLQGSIGFRFLLSTSFTQGQNVVPFYFQPTLGGGDLNSNVSLSSFQDYRFRAPNVMLLRESFEHSIWGPLGFALSADEGKVALHEGDLGSTPWWHSFATGLTLRAGGFPQVFLLFAWGGGEGTHTIANVNTSLLGGSARPSLF